MPFFSYESKFSQAMLKLCSTAWLNLLWFLCSLPIFTAGASTTALYYVTLKMARDEETNLTKLFFKSFRSNGLTTIPFSFPKIRNISPAI